MSLEEYERLKTIEKCFEQNLSPIFTDSYGWVYIDYKIKDLINSIKGEQASRIRQLEKLNSEVYNSAREDTIRNLKNLPFYKRLFGDLDEL